MPDMRFSDPFNPNLVFLSRMRTCNSDCSVQKMYDCMSAQQHTQVHCFSAL